MDSSADASQHSSEPAVSPRPDQLASRHWEGLRGVFATGLTSAAGYLQTKAAQAADVTKEAAASAALAAQEAAVNAATSAQERLEITTNAKKLLDEGGQEVEDRLAAKMAALEAVAAHRQIREAITEAAKKLRVAETKCSKVPRSLDRGEDLLRTDAEGYGRTAGLLESALSDLQEPTVSPVEADAIRMLGAKLGARWAAEQTREGVTIMVEQTREGMTTVAEQSCEAAHSVAEHSGMNAMAEHATLTISRPSAAVATKAAGVLEWGTQKIPEIADMDMSDLIMAKTIADINRFKTSVEHIFVSHKVLKAIHLINRDTANQKCDERAASVRAALPLITSNGMKLSESFITGEPELKVFKSVTGFQVVEFGDGGYVTFEGNGRRESLKRAFHDMPDVDVQVEVRLYKFSDEETAKRIRDQVKTCREWKSVDD